MPITDQSSQMIWMMIAICIVFVVCVIFQKQLKYLLQFIIQGTIGGLGFLLINTLFSFLGITLAVGVNGLTFLITGLLGLPGFVMLYGIMLVL